MFGVCSFDRDNDLAAGVALFEVTQRVNRFAHGVSLLDERLHLAVRHQFTEELQVRLVRRGPRIVQTFCR